MDKIFSLNWKILVILATLCFHSGTSIWDFAVCTQKNIIFYDAHWNEIAEAASGKLGDLKSITYDATHDVFYFIDTVQNKHTNINSLKLKSDGSIKIKTLIQLNDPKVSIWDLAYDFNDDALFYSDYGNMRIMKVNFNRKDVEDVKVTEEVLVSTAGEPFALELDACRRNLYFTLKSGESTVNVVSIKDKNPKLISNKMHKQLTAIALDTLTKRIYVTDKDSKIFFINSFTTEGDDFRVDLKVNGVSPRGLAVDHEHVYYLDGTDHTLKRIVKHPEFNETSEFFMKFQHDPKDIIVRRDFSSLDLSQCDVTEERIKALNEVMERVRKQEGASCETSVRPKTCLHGGFYDERTSSCVCKDSYDGGSCEIDLCYNFCLNGGECSMEKDRYTARLMPTCSCTKGFTGSRCESDVCSNLCLNSGKCALDKFRRPICECSKDFTGKRCENEIKSHSTLVKDVEEIPAATEESIKDESLLSNTTSKCPVGMNFTYIILAICLTLSLFFFLVILLVIRRFHKPMRPKIRKKFVVHKNIDNMTYRPTTEQCEVIIEDCCNMNICDTPCFDPKILQQEINENNIKVKLTTSKRCGSSSKDDKQDLLKNMELNQ